MVNEILDILRYEAENSDYLQGFQICHSIGGGTGGSISSLLFPKLKDNYPTTTTQSFTVYPSPKLSDIVIEPYNAVFSMNYLINECDQTFVIDNEAVFNIAHNVLKQKEPKYDVLNFSISQVMSKVTCSLRYPMDINTTMKRMGVNLIAFPRLHFLLLSHAPLFTPGQGQKTRLSELTWQVWSSRSYFANIRSEDGKMFTAYSLYRGHMSSRDCDDEMAKMVSSYWDDFITWIPNNWKMGILKLSPQDIPMSAGIIVNTTAIKGVFQRICAQYAKIFKRRAFVHWYKGEGMEENEMIAADKTIRDLITEYQDHQDAVVDLEDDDTDDDDSEQDWDEEEEEEDF